MRRIWKYLDQGDVKHYFLTKADETSVCNISTKKFNYITWKTDPEELACRRKCFKCNMKLAKGKQ